MPKAPVWSDLTNSIYYVNFKTIWKQSSIHRYDATDKSTHSAYIKGYSSPAFIAPLTKECKDLFVVGAGHDIVIVRWDGKSKKATVESKILSIEADEDDRVIEDVWTRVKRSFKNMIGIQKLDKLVMNISKISSIFNVNGKYSSKICCCFCRQWSSCV